MVARWQRVGGLHRCSSPPARHASRLPYIPGLQGPAWHTCWTLADARAIEAPGQAGCARAETGRRPIGCIIMEALAMRGVSSKRSDGRPHGAAHDGPPADDQGLVRGQGVQVHTGARVRGIERASAARAGPRCRGPACWARSPRPSGLAPALGAPAVPEAPGRRRDRCACPQRLAAEADLVISATGVRPNIGFLGNSGIRCLVGVLTDEHLQTNVRASMPRAIAPRPSTRSAARPSSAPSSAQRRRAGPRPALNMIGQARRAQGRHPDQRARHAGLISASFGKSGRVCRAASMSSSPTRRQPPEPAVLRRPAGGLQLRRLDAAWA